MGNVSELLLDLLNDYLTLVKLIFDILFYFEFRESWGYTSLIWGNHNIESFAWLTPFRNRDIGLDNKEDGHKFK